MSKITTVDLFCGAGGFTEGFKKAGGFETVLAVDFDKQAIDTFKHNHPNTPAICSDVSDIEENQLLALTDNTNIQVVIGGPPCQGFSLAGRRLVDDPKNLLFKEYVRIVDILKPDIFVFENVVGLVSMQGGLVLEAICSEFSRIGYEISHGILNSADYGVPQARPRFILIGSRHKQRIGLPLPTHDSLNSKSMELFKGILKPHITVGEALSNLPKIGQGEGEEEAKNQLFKNDFQELIRGDRKPGYLFNQRATRHSEKIVERYSHMPQGGDIRSLPEHLRTKKNNVFRLNETTPSRTITCNFRTDIIHPWEPRGLTTREAARLQSFDDDYQFFGNLTRKAKYLTQDDQVGNAVPPLLAKAIANHIKDYL
ncbi:DNA cytosine methyltransferase [Thalassotalea sp. M1531]|uniref:DNA (cytosine-5-)-methyltransferase n=1 Tax=Thalassotalea algicola TaxID=2716224 RepID=A0A7Y0LE57_9GAMM|nr:DNA cytosine methyltransferase [Thalassotalea algicola]NMP32558.1 DNA cytosine methyltransferase [Thalassotalea algicola]